MSIPYKLAALGLACTLLSGCAVFGPSERARDNAIIVELENKIDRFRAQYPKDTLEYGYGETLEQAQQQARNGLANQILVSVRTSTSSQDSLLAGQAQSRFEASSYSFSNLRLKDTRVLQRGLLEEGEQVYAIVAVDQAMVEQIRTQAEKRVGVLSLVEKLERDSTLSRVQRMQLAGQGLALAKRLGISDEPFVIRKQELNYRVYFNSVIDEQKQQLALAFEPVGRNLAVTLFDRTDLKPVAAGLPLRYGNQVRNTDGNGRAVFSPVTGDPAVYLALGDGIYLDRHDPGKKFGRVYVSSQPEGALVELYQDGKLVETQQTPGYFSVSYRQKKDYQLKVVPEQDYEPFSMDFNLQQGYDVFVNKEFAEIKYGGLMLTADSGLLNPDNLIELRDGHDKLVYEGESFERERLPTGRYSVTLSKPDNKDFQVVTDQVFVREGVTLERHYKEPKDREFYRSGMGLTLGFRANRVLPEGHPLEVKSGTPPTSPDYDHNSEDIHAGGDSIFLGLKGYGEYFTAGVEVETMFGGETGYADSSTHSGIGGSVSVGLYHQMEKGALWQLDLGYTRMEVESDEEASFEYSADLSSNFVELSFSASGGMIGARYYPELGTAAVALGLSGAKIKSGYRHPEKTSARAENHY